MRRIRSDAIYVNLYVSSETSFRVDAKELGLSVESEMPWGGASKITVSTTADVQGRDQAAHSRLGAEQACSGHALRLRRQDRRRKPTVSVNGKSVSAVPDGAGYVSLDRHVEERRRGRSRVSHRGEASRGRPRCTRTTDAEWPSNEGRSSTARNGPTSSGGQALNLLVDPPGELKASVDNGVVWRRHGDRGGSQEHQQSIVASRSRSRSFRIICGRTAARVK